MPFSHCFQFFVTATDASRALWSPFLLRSYPNPTSPIEGAADIAFSTALRATSAAPTYFSPVQLPPSTTLVDGGCVANNPAELAVFEAAHLFNQTPTLILSIGTGVPLPGPGSVNMLKLVNEVRPAISSHACRPPHVLLSSLIFARAASRPTFGFKNGAP